MQNSMYNQSFEKELQKQASEFLKCYYLLVNGIVIYPKEIEVYYYEQGKFEDYTVHRNQLQANNQYKFYVHRYGQEENSSYINNNRGGCDFVVSDNQGIFHSFLLRSIVINDELFVGPRKSLNAILDRTGFSYEELENAEVVVKPIESTYDVLTTPRIGLGEPNNPEGHYYKDAKLRFLLCDEYFKKVDKNKVGYRNRTEAMDNFLKEKIELGEMSKEEAANFSRHWLGYVSKWLKD